MGGIGTVAHGVRMLVKSGDYALRVTWIDSPLLTVTVMDSNGSNKYVN